MEEIIGNVLKIILCIILLIAGPAVVWMWIYRREVQRLKRMTQAVVVTNGVNDPPPPYPGRGFSACNVITITGGLMTYHQATENDTPPSYDSITPRYHIQRVD